MAEAMRRAASRIPPDVEAALLRARAEESDSLARTHLDACLENFRSATQRGGLVCGDTGFPLFFVRAGAATRLEGGFESLWMAAQRATERVTGECLLRPTMVDPLTRENPGHNVGAGMPKVSLRFSGEGGGLEIAAAPKGGGSEIFGTFYRMLFPADGEVGIRKFVIDCVRESCYAGKICPPAILGVGIGGTADLCMTMAKEAALLLPVGSQSADPKIARLEQDLLKACRALGMGPMGARGINAVIGLRIQTAMTHTAALPVAVNAQCLVGRRWFADVSPEGDIQYRGDPR